MIYKACTHHYFACTYKILILNLLETQQFPPTYMHTNKKNLIKNNFRWWQALLSVHTFQNFEIYQEKSRYKEQ